MILSAVLDDVFEGLLDRSRRNADYDRDEAATKRVADQPVERQGIDDVEAAELELRLASQSSHLRDRIIG